MRFHPLLFILISAVSIFLHRFINPIAVVWQVPIALLLFFSLGIPHGALDLALGKQLLKPRFGSKWLPLFLMSYLACVSLIIGVWILYPAPSFLFFLFISIIHFGFSDRIGSMKGIEGWARGVLPLAAPAYFYKSPFQSLVESSLPNDSAALVTSMASYLFFPCAALILFLVIFGLFKKEILNSLELMLLLLLFMTLSPFAAFLIYFCFLHSLRHILLVLEEMNLPFSRQSLKWVILQALPSTLATLIALSLCYFAFKEGALDLKWMTNLFFISLAGLTFPHMLLVETVKRRGLKIIPNVSQTLVFGRAKAPGSDDQS